MIDPMYQQIADDLRRQIESGDLAPGAKLPTEPELMAQYGASRNTIRDAIKRLVTPGLVETHAGQGTFVTERPNPFVSTLTGDPRTGETNVFIQQAELEGREPSFLEPTVEMQRADQSLAAALKISEGAHVVSRHYRCLIDGTPWSLQTSFYPMTLVEQGAKRLIQREDIKEGAVDYIAKACGIEQASYSDTIAVRAPDEAETGFFRLPADGRISVFEISRIAFDEEGTPIRLTITAYPADRNKFVVNVGDVPVAPLVSDNDER